MCATLAWQPIFTASAERYNEEVLSSAVRVYAILRGINAALSLAKETEIGVQLVGSVTTQPAMVLDPIDETVARVSDVVFLLAAASGILKLAFVPMAQLGAGLAALGFLMLYAVRLGAVSIVLALGRSFVLFGLLLALALPVGYGLGGRLGVFWTETPLAEAQAMLDGSAEEISNAVGEAQALATQHRASNQGVDDAADASLWGRVWDNARMAGDAASSAVRDAVPDMDDVQKRGSEILESSLTLVAIYAFRLLVLPFVLLWIFGLLIRRALGP
ncbi:MAG: hypothetical protein AAGF94_09875 [Pseudomonadota bacterium]